MRVFLHRALLRALVACAALIVVDACRCGKTEEEPVRGSLEQLVDRRVPDTGVVLALPKGWLVDMPDPGKLPTPPPPGSKIELRTRTLVVARPGTPAPGTLVAPQLLVMEDPWLPIGTSGVDYLVAQRASNQQQIGTGIRHVEAEPSRRQGRPSYHVRDEWTVQGPGGMSRDVSQEALLLLESVTAPDGQPAMHGYTVVITLEKSEFATLRPLVRDILASVRFDARGEGAATSGDTPSK